MAYLQGLCLVLVASLCGICRAQCIIRTIMPSMAVMECPSGPTCSSSGGCENSSSSADDLGALLLLARALEMDRANQANNGIDVNALLDTLIRALVNIATQDSGSSSGGNGYVPGFSGAAPNTGNGRPGGSGGLGLPATLKGLTGSLSEFVGGGEGGSGVTGLVDGVLHTVEGVLGGDGGSKPGGPLGLL